MGNLGYNPYKWSYHPTYNWYWPIMSKVGETPKEANHPEAEAFAVALPLGKIRQN